VPFGPSLGRGIENRSGSSIGRQLLSLRSIELPKRKQSWVLNSCSVQLAPRLCPPGLSSKVRDLGSCIPVSNCGQATVLKLVSAPLVLATCDRGLKGRQGYALRPGSRVEA
jgi:hypothetical protein